MADNGDYDDIDSFLNLDAIDQYTSVGASAGPQQDPATLLQQLHPVPDAPFIQPGVHAAAPSGLAPAPKPVQHRQMLGGQLEFPAAAAIQHQELLGDLQAGGYHDLDKILGDPSAYDFQDHMEMPAPIAHLQGDIQGPSFDHVPVTAVQHQQMLGDASAYDFQDHMVMPAPVAHVQHDIPGPSFDHVQHPQVPVTAVQHQQFLGDASAYDFQDHIVMPAPFGHVQHDIQGAPSDQVPHPQVPATAVEHQRILGDSSASGIHGQISGEEFAYGGGEEQPLSALSGSFDMVAEYLRQDGGYDVVSEDFVGDPVNHDIGNVGPMEDEVDFVPLVPGRLQCDHCRVVRKIKCQSETQEQFIFLHSVTDGTFAHAILERRYLGDDSQVPRVEQLYINFTGSTPEFVLNFIASRVESLKKETGGAVEDSESPIINDSYQQTEFEMLTSIFNPSAQNVEAAQPPSPPMEAAANTNLVDGLPAAPSIFQSMVGVQKDQLDESAELQHSSMPAVQQERAASSTLGEEEEEEEEEEDEEEETRQYLRELKEKAERELATKFAIEIKRFCRSTGSTWKLERIRRLNRRIIKYGENLYMFRLSKLIDMRKTADELVIEKEQLFAQITGDMKKEQGKRNDREAGPSRTKKGRAARAPV
ncbi:unnamed protein product [Alopecurus aequalis]